MWSFTGDREIPLRQPDTTRQSIGIGNLWAQKWAEETPRTPIATTATMVDELKSTTRPARASSWMPRRDTLLRLDGYHFAIEDDVSYVQQH